MSIDKLIRNFKKASSKEKGAALLCLVGFAVAVVYFIISF